MSIAFQAKSKTRIQLITTMPCSLCKSPHHNKRTCNKIPKNAAEAPRPAHKKLRARINAGARSVGEECALTPPWDPSLQSKRAKSARVIKKRCVVTCSKSCAKPRATAKRFRAYRQRLALAKKQSQNKSREARAARAQARARNFIAKCPCDATQPAPKPRLTWAQALFATKVPESRKTHAREILERHAARSCRGRMSPEQRAACSRRARKHARVCEAANAWRRDQKRRAKPGIKNKHRRTTSATNRSYGSANGTSLPGSSSLLQSIYVVAAAMKKLVANVRVVADKQS